MWWRRSLKGDALCSCILLLPLQVVLTTREGAVMSGKTLPVSYPKLPSMVQPGDTIFLGRYLVTGSEESSCYLTVRPHCPALLFSHMAYNSNGIYQSPHLILVTKDILQHVLCPLHRKCCC